MRHSSIVLVVALAFIAHSGKGQTWQSLINEADTLFARGNADSAWAVGERALRLARSTSGELDTNVATVMHKLGEYYSQGDTRGKAKDYFQKSLAIRQRLLPPNHIDIGKTLTRLGRLILGEDVKTAEETLRHALALLEHAAPVDNYYLGLAHSNLGVCLLNLGNPAEARVHFEEGLRSYQNISPAFTEIASMYVRLAIASYYLGSHKEAEEYFRQAIDFHDKHPEPSYLAIGNILTNFGAFLQNEGKAKEAEEMMKRAISTFEAAKDTGWLIFNLVNLGQMYNGLNDFEHAEIFLERARQTSERWSVNEPGKFQNLLKALGSLYARQRMFDKAEKSLLQAKEVVSGYYGPDGSEIAGVLSELVLLYLEMNRPMEAWNAGLQSVDKRQENLLSNLELLSEKEALSYSGSLRVALSALLTSYFGTQSLSDSMSNQTAWRVLATKGLVSDAVIFRNLFDEASRDTVVKALAIRLHSIREELAKSFASHDSRVDSLTKLSNVIESQLSRAAPTFGSLRQNLTMNIESVTSVIPPNSTIVEYYYYYQISPQDTVIPHYLICTLNEFREVAITDLGEADKIDRLIGQYRQHFFRLAKLERPLSQSDQTEYKSATAQLYNLIWKPIVKYIKPNNTLFIAPDAGLNLVSFAGLMDENGKYLIEKHPIHYLSAGRDLIRISQDSSQSGVGMLALGDPDYDATAEQRLSSENILALNTSSKETGPASGVTLNVRSSYEALSEMNVKRLPNTKTEIEAIAKFFPLSDVLKARAASEENFKRHAAGRKAIHIATHGYFISGECQGKPTKNSESYVGENPLLQSGLLLAGANLHGADVKTGEAEDGIVTALEVSNLDLRGTDLVVLSACETGLGKVEQGEGVYGLRRAFQMAGTRTVVSALWRVPDKETSQFMKELYANMSSHGAQVRFYPELMQQVALARIRELRLRGRPTHPFAWGAFVATGDWRIR